MLALSRGACATHAEPFHRMWSPVEPPETDASAVPPLFTVASPPPVRLDAPVPPLAMGSVPLTSDEPPARLTAVLLIVPFELTCARPVESELNWIVPEDTSPVAPVIAPAAEMLI